tara:strand:- start:122 stop:289 length:168 start_codon:yes stop_codon:yes gene_type:complete
MGHLHKPLHLPRGPSPASNLPDNQLFGPIWQYNIELRHSVRYDDLVSIHQQNPGQ